MRKLFFSIFFLVLVSNSFGQLDAIGTFNRFVIETWAGQYVRIGNYKVKGSPFLFGESFPGKVKYKGDNASQTTKVLYNLYEQTAGPGVNGEILVANKILDEFSLDLPEKFGGVSLEFKHCSLFSKDDLKLFFNVLADGNSVAFLKAYRIRVVADPSNMMDKELKVFEQYYEYYLCNHNGSGKTTKVKLKKKDIENVLSTIPGASEILKSHQSDLSTEAGVLSLVNALNYAAK